MLRCWVSAFRLSRQGSTTRASRCSLNGNHYKGLAIIINGSVQDLQKRSSASLGGSGNRNEKPDQAGRAKSTLSGLSSTEGSGLSMNVYDDLAKIQPQDAPKGSAVSHFEEWMLNLRGNDEWLHGNRTADWYTGKQPLPGVCPGVTPEGIKALPLPNLNKVTRQATQEYFDNIWTTMETLFAGFKGEEPFYRPPVHGLRHPQIFYYGHSPCLYVNKLRVSGVLDGPVNPYFESIFEVGVDEMLWDDMHKNDMIWPTVAEVHEYRKEVYKAISNVIATHPALDDKGGESPVKIDWNHPMWALFMGFEHERIHLETSSVLFRETPLKLMQLPVAWPAYHPSAHRPQSNTSPSEGTDFPANEMLAVKGGDIELGKPRDFPSYGWDNEYGHRAVTVPEFSASKYMISNGEFWHFVSSGGYRTKKYWSEDGWGWRVYRNVKWPFFWEPDGPEGSFCFKVRTIFEVKDMQWDWPVDVNYHEARAFCAWKSEMDGLNDKPEAYRVITEAEHHFIRDKSAQMAHARAKPEADRAMWAGGDCFAYPEPGAANLNLAYSTQSPVDALPPSPTGHHDAMGNAWEWCEDHFNQLEGFEVHRVYDDFSMPCFDGQHHMIMGGSFMSSGDNGASIFCRYHFRPHFLQHSSFRLVSSSESMPAKHLTQSAVIQDAVVSKEAGDANIYETESLVHQYLGLHFPQSGSESIAPIISHAGAPQHALRFPQRVAQLLHSLKPAHTNGRALDLGCAVGGASFELAALGFDEVVGIDFSAAFVDAATRMQRLERIPFRVPVEADIHADVVAQHEPNVTSEILSRVSFQTGDACRLREYSKDGLGKFDGALLANLLCRLPSPISCLEGLAEAINPGGVAVIVTPFSWLEEFTHRSKWLGGFNDPVSGQPITSKDELRKVMERLGFEKIHEEQMPLVIREHQRKYQYIVSEASGWRRT